ncbi:MAG: L-threonylcarbamoyladenylate synthase [Clostridium sp.]
MDTKVYYISNDEAVIKEAADCIKNGNTVAFPTETVYGLGANALDKNACDKIFKAKGRPQDNPLIVHVADKDISEYVKEIPSSASRLIDEFWPGPLTIILPKKDIIPIEVTGGLKSVAIRMPKAKVARDLIKAAGVPIAAPSANLSGKPSPTTVEHCIRDLSGRVSMILGGQVSECGLESTIVEVTGDKVTILRPGAITFEMITELGIKVEVDPVVMKTLTNESPRCPGMKYRHYAPESEMEIVLGDNQKVVEYINDNTKKLSSQGKKVMVISTSENLNRYKNSFVLNIGSRSNLPEVASRLFDVLRECDTIGVDVIYSEGFSDEGVGMAIMNRLRKAASHRITKLD